jgi:hypothetical protein
MSNFIPDNNTTIEDGIKLYEERAAQALQMLASKGFGSPTPPRVQTQAGLMSYQGSLPPNLPDLDDNQLGYYMGLLTEWNAYVQCQLAEADVQFQKVKAILEHVEAKLRIAYGRDEEDKKRSNPERDDCMKADRRFLEASSNVIYWETIYTHIKAIANAAEQAFAAVSRRITQRGQEIDRGNRGNTVSSIPSGPMFGRHRG